MKTLFSRILSLLFILLFCGAARAEAAPGALRIAVASDLHLNESSRPGGEPVESQFSLELVDALLWDARQQGADFILLTGDIVNGGRVSRHEALCEKLARAEDAGLAVYVLPGNHDLSPVTQTEFAAFYADFGYGEAASRDSASLSYCVRRDGLLLLMLDTAGYPGAAYDLPDSPGGDGSAFLSDATLDWAAACLEQARAEGLRVLCAGHYNLLSPISRDSANEGYYVRNGERLVSLLREHEALLYLSGHIHTRAVYEEDGLRELVTEYLLAYPTGYSLLDLTDSALRYTPRRIDVDAWAAESGRTEAVLLHFSAWQQEMLRRSAVSTVASMAQRNPISESEQADAAAFFCAVMEAYWQGSVYDRREALEAMPGRVPFFRCSAGYAYGWWLQDLLENSPPALAGFTVSLG